MTNTKIGAAVLASENPPVHKDNAGLAGDDVAVGVVATNNCCSVVVTPCADANHNNGAVHWSANPDISFGRGVKQTAK
jgi:hypothetical protein